MVCPNECSAQDYGVVDTIRVSEKLQFVQAYYDTVMIYERIHVSGPSLGMGFTRLGRDARWDSVDLSDAWPTIQPPMKGCVMAGLQSGGRDPNPDLLWILRDASTTRIDSVGRPGDKIGVKPIKRMRVHTANPRKIYAQIEEKFVVAIATATYVTNDDGETWKEINPPFRTDDAGRGHILNFDYTLPHRLYITVNPSGVTNPDAYLRAYYTDDDGETFHGAWNYVTSTVGLGIWSKTGGVGGNGAGIGFTSDSIGLPPGSKPGRFEPPWLENVRKSLFPNYDTTKQKLGYAFYDVNDYDGTIEGLAFHPEGPETFVARFRIDTLVGGKWYYRSFVFATRDFGKTWFFVVHPGWTIEGYLHGPTSLAIGPLEDAVYVSAIKVHTDSLTSKRTNLGSYTIKSTPFTTSIKGEAVEHSSSQLSVYPNPVGRGTPLIIALSDATTDNIAVTCSTLEGRQIAISVKQQTGAVQGSTSAVTMSTSDLVPGAYIIQTRLGSRTDSRLQNVVP